MAPKCPRCGKSVYMAEEKICSGKKWHKSCFLCKDCNKRLDSTTLCENEGEIFCKSCYGKAFGPKGYGYGGGAGTLSMDTGNRFQVPDMRPKTGPMPSSAAFGNRNACPRCGKAVYVAEKIVACAKVHEYTCKDVCFKSSQYNTAKLFTNLNSLHPCRNCSFHNKFAHVKSLVSWHKNGCFTCKDCNKRLDSTTVKDHGNEIYCPSCYGKNFGPKGFGYGQGAGALTRTR